MGVKIDILGGCVTRDVFRFSEEDKYTIMSYYARSSIVSIYSRPINIRHDEIKLDSDFQKRMVYYDLTKHFREYIKTTTADYFIFDLIVERLRVLKYGNSYLTRSNEFNKSNLAKKLKTASVSPEDQLKMWKQSMKQLMEDLKMRFLPDRIILHKAYWKDEYYNEDGERCQFVDKPIKENNERLMAYYEFIENNFDGIRTIELDNHFLADSKHKWGLSPFHYEEAYYLEFNKRLDTIVTETRTR